MRMFNNRAWEIRLAFHAGTLLKEEMQIVRLLLQEPYNASWEEIANLKWKDIDS